MYIPIAGFGRSSPGEKKVIMGCLPVIAIIVGLALIIYSLFAGPAGDSDNTSLTSMEAGILSTATGVLIWLAGWLLDRLFG